MDEKIQQLTNEQLLDVIVLVEENKIYFGKNNNSQFITHNS